MTGFKTNASDFTLGHPASGQTTQNVFRTAPHLARGLDHLQHADACDVGVQFATR